MPQGYTHMTQEERCQISTLKSIGFSVRGIAEQLNRSPSTILREIKMNSGQRGYRYKQAHQISCQRRHDANSGPSKMTSSMVKQINLCISLDWSPEQIAGRLSAEGRPISHETIYKHIWADKRAGGRLFQHLRHRAKPYKKRSTQYAGRGYIPNRQDISERPAVVETKSRIGDWEGDTIISAQYRGAIVSYVDRHSKFTILTKVERKTAKLVTDATIQKLRALPHPVHTITYDNGKEFSSHEKIAKELKAQCFFATPYHSWERGLNEHTNGLVRQYLPKNTVFSTIDDAVIDLIQDRLNHRPRKSLNYRTPFEVFFSNSFKSPGVALQT